jgi:hypothetical protein
MREFLSRTFYKNGSSYTVVFGTIDMNELGHPVSIRMYAPELIQKQILAMQASMDSDQVKLDVAYVEDHPSE